MSKSHKRRRDWERSTRAHIAEGHHAINGTQLPAVLIIDGRTGNVLPLSPHAAYKIADKIVDIADTINERGNQ